MDVMDAIRTRRAVRDFTATPVGKKEIQALVDAAIRAPSAMNLQPWAFAVVLGKERLEECGARAKRHLLSTITADSPFARHREMIADATFNVFYNAPALVVICATSAGSQASEDCCLAAENLMLAARAAGLGTCWIGFARPWLSLPEAKAELSIPAALIPVAPIIVGHPEAEPPITHRERAKIVWCK